MLGIDQTIVGNQVEAFEFLRIERVVDERLTYSAQPGGAFPRLFFDAF